MRKRRDAGDGHQHERSSQAERSAPCGRAHGKAQLGSANEQRNDDGELRQPFEPGRIAHVEADDAEAERPERDA